MASRALNFTRTHPSPADLICCTGEMSDLIRLKDWSETPLGPIHTWSQELLCIVNAALAAPTPLFVQWGPDLILLYNDAARPILSDKHPACLGRSARDVWEEAWHIVGSELEQVLATGASILREEVLVPIHINGMLQDLFFNYSQSAVYEAGRVAGVLTSCQEITRSVAARRQRDTLARELHQALEVTTDAVFSVNRDWRITYLNGPARKAVAPLGDPLNRNLWEMYPASVYEGSPFVQHFSRAMDENIGGEFEAYYPDPLDIWVQVQVRPSEHGIVIFFRNVTQQKKTAAALMQSEKLAAVGRLASSIAHEINNPLEAVTNLLYLARASDQPVEMRQYIDSAERELKRVATITHQTLRFHKQSPVPSTVSAAELFDAALSIFQGRLASRAVLVGRRDRATQSLVCFADEIRQVLINLIGNAIDAMPRQGGRLHLRSRTATQWGTGILGVLLTIADTGTGMSAEVVRKLFEPFFTTKGNAGTGLGLWVSQDIVRRHRGTVTLRSRETRGRSGTVFHVFLPFNAAVGAPRS